MADAGPGGPVCYHGGVAASHDACLRALAELARRQTGLRLLVLFGSRVRQDARADSDWDLGYLGTPSLDPSGLLGGLVGVLGTDRVDLVDLDRAGAQLRFRVAREGRPVYAADEAAFPRFWTEAVSFWCDAGPIIRAGYADVLAGLG